MTLVVTIVAPWGGWQCSDYRLTMLKNGRIVGVRDWHSKQVNLRCPDGECSVAYTGLATAPWYHQRILTDAPDDEVEEWIREHNAKAGKFITGPTPLWLLETLSGETRSVDQSLIRLRERASEVRAFRRMPTAFCAPCFIAGKAWFALITNGSPPREQFETCAWEITDPALFIAGDHGAVLPDERERLRRIISKRPAHVEDYFELLANTNRAAAKRSDLISPECEMTYFAPREGFRTKLETLGRESPAELLTPRLLLFGLNLQPLTEEFMRKVHVLQDEPPGSDEAG